MRELKNSDIKEIEALIKNTWDFSKYGLDEKTRELMAHYDLMDCLSRSNYARVFKRDGKISAFLLASIKKLGENTNKESFLSEHKRTREILSKSEKGRMIIDFFDLYETVNEILIKDESFDSEIVLLAVDEKERGRGIGRKMVTTFLDNAREIGVKNNLVFTDTTCNFNFYPAIGYSRRSKLKRSALLTENEPIEFYLYSKNL